MLFLSCLVLRLCIHRFHQLSGCGFPVPTFQDKLFCIWFYCPLLDVVGMIVCCVHFCAFCALVCSPPVETGFLASAAFTHCAFCVSLYGVCFLLYTFPPPMLFFLLFLCFILYPSLHLSRQAVSLVQALAFSQPLGAPGHRLAAVYFPTKTFLE